MQHLQSIGLRHDNPAAALSAYKALIRIEASPAATVTVKMTAADSTPHCAGFGKVESTLVSFQIAALRITEASARNSRSTERRQIGAIQ